MPIRSIPAHIHVDPNMHMGIYRHLLSFALVFDRVSLYGVSGTLLDEHFLPLKASGFRDLISVPKNPPFLLTAPSDFYNKQARIDRHLNPRIFGWHKIDEWIVGQMTDGWAGVIQADRSQAMRDTAWSNAFQYRDVIRKRLGKDQLLTEAYYAVQKQYEIDKALPSGDPEAVYTRILPATFFDRPIHTGSDYDGMLRDGDLLPLLFFEHFTKSQIIESIEQKISERNQNKIKLEMYIPGDWHSPLMAGLGLFSTAELVLDRTETLVKAVRSELLGTQLTEAFRNFTIKIDADVDEIIEEVMRFRTNDGPSKLRGFVESNLAKIYGKHPDVSMENALEATVREIRRLCANEQYKPWLETLLITLAATVEAWGVARIETSKTVNMDRREMLRGLLYGTGAVLLLDEVRSPQISAAVARYLLGPREEKARELAGLLQPLFGAAQPSQAVQGLVNPFGMMTT